MFKVVVDTNVVVSAALTPNGNAAMIMNLIFEEVIQVFYNARTLFEYEDVLSRSRLNLSTEKQTLFIDGIKRVGIIVTPFTSKIPLPDESDRIFYDTAKGIGAILITGNTKHYPDETFIMTPAEYLQTLSQQE